MTVELLSAIGDLPQADDVSRNLAVIPATYLLQLHFNLPLRNRKHIPCFYKVIVTREEVWENEHCYRDMSRVRVFPHLFRVLQTLTNVSLTPYKHGILFLLENTARKERKVTCLF